MAEPKKRTNKSKTGMRRMHHKATSPSLNYCSHCHEPAIRHHVCQFCGYYKGKKVIDIVEKKSAKPEDEPEESKESKK